MLLFGMSIPLCRLETIVIARGDIPVKPVDLPKPHRLTSLRHRHPTPSAAPMHQMRFLHVSCRLNGQVAAGFWPSGPKYITVGTGHQGPWCHTKLVSHCAPKKPTDNWARKRWCDTKTVECLGIPRSDFRDPSASWASVCGFLGSGDPAPIRLAPCLYVS